MPDWIIYALPWLSTLLFVAAFGACVGSLINVLVYRIPLGLDVVRPTSRCPSCQTKLTWRENIPIFGWIMLRGKCRFCGTKISAEYPIVEAVVAFLFAGIYALWYIVPDQLGADAAFGLGAVSPEWASNGVLLTWPAMVVLLILVGSMVAMTIIDARTSTIPLVLTWVPAIVALVFHTGHAIWFQAKYGQPEMLPAGMNDVWQVPNAVRMRWSTAPGEIWTLATGGLYNWKFIGVGIGGTIGLIISNLMLKFGVLTRSFADFEDWYKEHFPHVDESQFEQPETEGALNENHEAEVDPAKTETSDQAADQENENQSASDTAEDWLMYPHARREMIRELAFLCLPVLLGVVGGWAFVKMFSEMGQDPYTMQSYELNAAPLWLVVLCGVLMGYLIGGGVVWAVRIGGSLAFGKEAMGLGDVHLMAAVGACIGWIDPTIAFFLAAFVGVGYAILAQLFRNKLNRAMPYGPFLAIATLMVLIGKPLVEIGLGKMFGLEGPLNIP